MAVGGWLEAARRPATLAADLGPGASEAGTEAARMALCQFVAPSRARLVPRARAPAGHRARA